MQQGYQPVIHFTAAAADYAGNVDDNDGKGLQVILGKVQQVFIAQ